jgi:superfamily II DNA or RNA helicase
MVVIPHNALLAQQQHSTQEKYFCSTSLKVIYINSKNMRNYTETASDFDLCYISIHAFDILIKLHRAKLQSWNINVIFIDECHLLFAENFRLGKQWSSLYNLVSLGPRIVCTSATFCPTSIKSTATFLGMSIDNYQVIGGAADYIPPNVAIQTKTSNDNALITEVSDYIQHRINHNPLHEKFALYVIAMTKDRAVDLSNQLSGIDISSTSLTSDDTEILRTQKMNEWEKGNLKVLVSTFNCGLDCPYVKEVIFLGGCRAVVDAVQGMGRIRPKVNGIFMP